LFLFFTHIAVKTQGGLYMGISGDARGNLNPFTTIGVGIVIFRIFSLLV